MRTTSFLLVARIGELAPKGLTSVLDNFDIRDSHIGATVHTFLHNLSGKGTNELDRSDLCWILLCIVLCCQEKKAVDAHASAHEQAIASLVSRLNTVLATDPWHLQR